MLNPSALEISALRKRIFGLLFERRFLRRAACLHALSRIEAEAIRSYGLLNPIAIIPNGIDPPAPQTSSLPPWPSGNDGRKVLLYIGRLHPIKGLPTFLRAFARTSDEIRRARWRLVIAGWDQNGHRKELERLVRELAISRDVDFVGGLFDTEKTNALHMADAFVLPSTSEAQPVAVLEAWVHGLPTLLTTACNLPTAKTEKLGLVCNNSVEEFAASLQQLITMPKEELREMGSRAQVYTRAEYCWKTQSEKLKQVYAWICRNGDRPGCLFER
jgi:poly(glycerol-phosphate) alpha-glucosyltransferase